MKQKKFTRKALGFLLASFAFAALPASAYTLDVTRQEGWSNVFNGADDRGNQYNFTIERGNNRCIFKRVTTTESSVYVPDSINIIVESSESYEEFSGVYPVSCAVLYYHGNDDDCFKDCPSLKDIYLPSTITNAEFWGEGFAGKYNFHFVSGDVPQFNVGWEVGMINIYVPDNLFLNYAEALDDNNCVVFSEEEATPVNVNVAAPGTFEEVISAQVENLENVRWLVITGTPDAVDLRIIRRLTRLEKLDLSGATGLSSVGGFNNLRFLKEVTLPDGIESIDNVAFANCKSLSSLTLPASVKTIGNEAFRSSGIREINLENVAFFGNEAFRDSKLTYADLRSAEKIGEYAFMSCNLSGDLVLPEKVTRIEWYAFAFNSNIKKIVIPKDIKEITSYAFEGVRPEIVECNVLFPLETSGFPNVDYILNTTLYVPALTFNEYSLHDTWTYFGAIKALSEDLKTLDIDREYILNSDKGIADQADLNLYRNGRWYNEVNYDGVDYGHLTVNRSTPLNLGKFTQKGLSEGNYWVESENNFQISTLVAESDITADDVEINIAMRKNRWHFLSFPFDINVKDIVVDEDALWVVRKYSGEDRAKLSGNTWQNMTDETVLKAGEGYIFNCSSENRERINFTFRPASDGNALFTKDVITKNLASYPSEFAHNASWNLVGNSYPAYLNLKGVDFEAPITVWERNTYYAYSPLDDEFVLQPFQAFFVQAQDVEGGNVIALKPQARAHSAAAALDLSNVESQAFRAPSANNIRSLFNIYVKGENGEDRTRLVINENASVNYESNRDASKFMSSDEKIPQIFVNNNGIRMAIDERPLGDGIFTIGTRFGESGTYTISIDTRDAEGYEAILTDNVTGEKTNLLASDYTFNAEATTDENRFELDLFGSTGVESVNAEGLNVEVVGNVLRIVAQSPVEIIVVSADGKVIASSVSADFSTSLDNGIYVVKAGNQTRKVSVCK